MLEGARQYEISFLTLREGDKEAVVTAIAGAQGEIISEGRYAEIKLAYPIKKQTSAFFGSFIFSATPEKEVELEKALRFTEGVLRFIIITPPPRKPTRSFQPRTAESLAPAAELKEEKPEEISVKPEEKTEEVNDADLNDKLQEILG